MKRSLIVCDRLMYGALLAMIFFLPYSIAIIQIALVAMIVAWVAQGFLSGKVHGLSFFSKSLKWSLIAIALLIVLTIPLSHYHALSLKKFFSRFLQQIFLMYLVTQIVSNRKRLYNVLFVLLLTMFFVSIDGMVQFFWGKSIVHHTTLLFGRVTGPMNHPNDLGTLLATVLPLVLTSIIAFRRWRSFPWIAPLLSVLFLCLLFVLGLTDSRGAWIAFAVSMIGISLCIKQCHLKIIIPVIIVLFFWLFCMRCLSTRIDIYNVPMKNGPVLSPSITNPFGLPPGYNAWELLSGSSGRVTYWSAAIGIIKKHLWYGCGYNAYGQTLKDLRLGHDEYPHNSLLQITAELGLAGLLLYGWFFTALFLDIKTILRKVASQADLFLIGVGASLGIVAWMVHGMIDTDWASFQLSILWWLLIGVLFSFRNILLNLKEGEKSCLLR